VLAACIVALTAVGCSLRLLASRRLQDVPLVVVTLAVWLAVNKPLEGRVLLGLTVNHGVTVADVLTVPPALLCMAVIIATFRRRRRGKSPGTGADNSSRAPADRAS
jgi:hypothetical protein